MTDLLSFSDIAGNKIDLSSSENYKNHAFAEHSCVVHILKQFDTDFYWFLKENEDLNMIDLGANIGLFSMFAAPICEKVFSVEPTPSHFALMQELVDLAGIKNIEMLNLAVGTEDGEAEFNIHERNSTMNSFIIALLSSRRFFSASITYSISSRSMLTWRSSGSSSLNTKSPGSPSAAP